MLKDISDRKSFKIAVILLTASVGIFLFALFALNYNAGNQKVETPSPQISDQIPQPQQIATEITASENNIAAVVKSAIPAVVGVSVLKVDESSIFDRNATEKWGMGSGVIVTENGYILTNHHVAGGESKRIIVSLADGRNVDGVTVWSDSVLDLAVVKVNATGLATVPIGDSTKLQVGETAIAIGNPLGLQFQRTVTSGIISALNRTIKIETDEGTNFMEDLIQTDASINPGNSGGPLLNSKGELIGINTVKVTSAEGIGFAIPVNIAVPIIKHYIEDGEFQEPYLGVFAYDKEVLPYLDGSFNLDKGVYVAKVDESGPAYKKGIKVGCIITQVDGQDIYTMMQLRTIIYSKKPGDTINVTHVSNNKTKVVQITLGSKNRDGLLTR